MKIREFIEAYNTMSVKSTAALTKMLEIKPYIPVMRKRTLAEIIFNAVTSVENNIIVVDSLNKYICFTMLMITEYTNLEFTVDENGLSTPEALEEYDELCANNLINPILACFADDYARSNEVLNYVFQDRLAAVNSSSAVLGRAVDYVVEIIENLSGVFEKKINNMNDSLAEFDPEMLNQIISILPENVK